MYNDLINAEFLVLQNQAWVTDQRRAKHVLDENAGNNDFFLRHVQRRMYATGQTVVSIVKISLYNDRPQELVILSDMTSESSANTVRKMWAYFETFE